ncbi:protein phosphatase 2C domain-containing protein [Yinghuangia sp. YIM S09857]|uniref:protein phosphatase 2C domain-containing protein n=1 Tax=Yinghuangia sp. YIM S09857 TaxID=3436929 RepID=UPI003F53DDC5
MPDGFDRRPTTGDRQPARRTTARQYDDDDLYDEPRRGGDPYGDPYQDDYDDAGEDTDEAGGGDRPGAVRRIANWLGLGVGSDETYGEPRDRGDDGDGRDEDGPDGGRRGGDRDRDDFYDAAPGIPPQPTSPPARPVDEGEDADSRFTAGRRGGRDPYDVEDDERTSETRLPDPRSARTGDNFGLPDDDADSIGTAGAGLPPATRPRRTRATSPWEDIMLGSGPPPGTPMSDAMPAGTLPPDTYAVRPPAAAAEAPSVPLSESPSRRAGERTGERAGERTSERTGETRSGSALSDWLDPMDPVDPLHPDDPAGTSGTTEEDTDTGGRTKTTTAATAGGSEDTGSDSSFDDPGPTGTITAIPVQAPPPPPATAATAAATAVTSTKPGTTPPPAKQPTAPPSELRDQRDDYADESPEPRRMLRLLPTPVLSDGGGMVVDGGGIGRLTVRAAAARGDLHSQQGTPRQNCFASGPDPSRRWTISIICDGVDGGYAPELAAQVAIRSTYRAVSRMAMSDRYEDWDWTTTLAGVQAELRTRLAEIGAKAKTLGRPAPATRLAVLVTSAEPMQDDRVDMAVLGDSTILRLAEGGWRAPLGIRETPADVPPPALPEQGTEHVRVCRTTWRPSDALVLMTGGFAESLGAGSGGLAARLAEDWRRPPELLDFLGDVVEGSHTDDGAVVALWPEP